MATPADARKLGRLPYRDDPRTLRLADYIDFAEVLPNVPPAWTWDDQVAAWPMFLNDRLGDCTCASVAHHVELLTAAAGHQEAAVADSDVLGLYEQASGYDPNTGQHDDGAVILDVLNLWRQHGLAGHRIEAFVEVDHTNRALLEAGCYLFGGLQVGLNMPIAAQQMGRYWHLPRSRGADSLLGSWGGHAVYAVDYNRSGVTVVSWGELIHATWGFWNEYVEEAWACLGPDWLAGGKSPQGFDLAALQADLGRLGHIQ